jgi:RND family efflux transporter MFP subunit
VIPSATPQPQTSGVAAPAAVTSAAPQVAAAATATPNAKAPRTVLVKRDSLTETLSLDGAVAAITQQPVNYAYRAAVNDIKVKPGQNVKKGDLLVSVDTGEQASALEQANAQLVAAQKNLARAEANAVEQQKQAEQRAALADRQRQVAMQDAQLAVNRAQDNLARVKSQAEAALKQALAGPDAATVQAAARDQASAQLAAQKAQADLDALTTGADAATIRTAQLAVQRAEAQLQIAQTTKPDPKMDAAAAKIAHDTAVQDAQLALDNAQAKLSSLKQPPSDLDVQTAQLKVTDAQTALAAATQRYEKLQAGPDQATVNAARKQNDNAQRGEVATAEDQLRTAQRALDALVNAPPDSAPAAETTTSDAQDAVDKAQATVNAAQATLEGTRIRAPMDGIVVSVRARIGEYLDPTKPVVVLATADPPIVRVDLDATQAGRVTTGQQAMVDVGDGTTPQLVTAVVADVTPAAKDGTKGPQATLQVNWGDDVPRFGTQVQARIAVDRKEGVLVVPTAAVRQLGTRTTVEVQDGTLRRVVPVQIGIRSPDSIEIVAGLAEGQQVLVAPAR